MRWCHFLSLLALLTLCNCPSAVLSPDWLSATAVLCPDRLTSCSLQTSTCCKSSYSSRYLCCPFPNAVCCEDGQHCCPQCFSCNVKGSSCTSPATTAAAVRIAALTSASYNPRAVAVAEAAAKPRQATAARPQQPPVAAAPKLQPRSPVTKEAETKGGGGLFSGVLSAVRSTFFSSSGKTTSDSPAVQAPPTPPLINKLQAANQHKRVNVQPSTVASNARISPIGVGAKQLPGGVRKVAPTGVGKVTPNAGGVTHGAARGISGAGTGSLGAGRVTTTGRVAPGGGRVTPGGGKVAPGGGRVAPGGGSVTPGVGRVSQTAHTSQSSSSFVSKAHGSQASHKIAHSKQAPPTRSQHASPSLTKQVPPTQLNLRQARDVPVRTISHRQTPPTRTASTAPSVKVTKGKESEESKEEGRGFFSAVFSTFYGTGKKSEPEVVESKPQQSAATHQGKASTVNKAKLQTASAVNTFQQRGSAVPRREGIPAIAKATQQNIRVQSAVKPPAPATGKSTAAAAARPKTQIVARSTATATAKTPATATVRKVTPAISRSPATAAARPAAGPKAPSAAAQQPALQQQQKPQQQKVQAPTLRNAPIINPMKFVPRPPVGFTYQQQHPANKKMSNVIQKPIVPRAALFTQHKQPVAVQQQKSQRKY